MIPFSILNSQNICQASSGQNHILSDAFEFIQKERLDLQLCILFYWGNWKELCLFSISRREKHNYSGCSFFNSNTTEFTCRLLPTLHCTLTLNRVALSGSIKSSLGTLHRPKDITKVDGGTHSGHSFWPPWESNSRLLVPYSLFSFSWLPVHTGPRCSRREGSSNPIALHKMQV